MGKDTRVYLDADPSGLAVMPFQLSSDAIWRPTTFASRSLTKIECKYSQIEKEALCPRWACKKLYMYLITSKFVLITDHQPLLSMFNNPNSYSTSNDLIMLCNISQVNLIPLIIYLATHFDTTLNTRKREHIVKAIVKGSIPEAVTLTKVLDAPQKLTGCISLGRFNACKKDPNTNCY